MQSTERGTAFMLALFLAAHTLLAMDRAVIAVVLEPIKQEFHVSDSALGLIGGAAFALFFGVAGVPIGRLVDKRNRRNILVGSVATFSTMTAAAAGAANFGLLLATRVMVGAGEAGGGPAMISMISDRFGPERRASAVATYYAGVPIGSMVIFLGGGWVAAHFGWRSVFLFAGAPGMLLAALLLWTVKEPARRADRATPAAPASPFWQSALFLWSQTSLRHLMITSALTSAGTSGLFTFTAAYLMRVHGAPITQVGMLMGLSYGAVGACGTLGSGVLVDRLARRDVRWRGWFILACCLLLIPAVLALVLATNLQVAAIAIAVWALLSTACYGPIMALVSSLAGSRLRGTAIALYYLMSYFVGVSVGAQLVGLVSDGLAPSVGVQSLRYGIAVTMALYLWAAFHLWRASTSLPADLARAEAL